MIFKFKYHINFTLLFINHIVKTNLHVHLDKWDKYENKIKII